MSVEKRLFGKLSNNSDVFEYTLKNSHGMIAKLITYGAAITQLWVPDRNGVFADVVGGYDTAEKYEKGNSSQGAVVGRVGNRICDGKFTLDGVEYSLYVNDRGVHLHGGESGVHLLLCGAARIAGAVASDPGIDLHPVAAASSHELIYGRVEHLTLDIPESLVDAGKRAHQNAAATVEARAVDGAPDILNA